MSDPDPFLAASEATWPPASAHREGPWIIRDGQRGGKRVSAATAAVPVTGDDIALAERAMTTLGQPPLFMIRSGDDALDTLLEGAGYELVDPVAIYAAPVATLASDPPPPVSAFTIWPPLKIMEEIWQEGGIGPARLAVMHRVAGLKTAILGRSADRAAGTAFVAIHENTAVVHAVVVAEAQRRQRTAVNMMRKAAIWAQDHGVSTLCVLVTTANAPARALYASLGMEVVGYYHYRKKPAKGESS